MKKTPKLSHQDIRDRLKEIRSISLEAFSAVYSIDEGLDTPKSGDYTKIRKDRLAMSINDLYFYLQNIHRSISIVLQYTDTSGCYSEDAGETLTFSLPSGPPEQVLRSLAEELEEVRNEMRGDLFNSLSQYYTKGFAIQHYQDAIIKMTLCIETIKQVAIILSDEESDIGENKRVQSISDEVLPSNQGFQASARPG